MEFLPPRHPLHPTPTPVLIIGAGSAGLATAACLTAKSIPCLILEQEDTIASRWKYRTYDRLHLRLPKQYCELPLLSFPESYPKYPSRQQFIQYLNDYREHFGINPVYNTKVTMLEYSGIAGNWLATAEQKTSGIEPLKVRYVTRSVVLATGENADPYFPSISGGERFRGEITHSMTYRNGAKYEGKKVLVVGVGNTGMEIALDLANFGAKPSLVVRNKFHILPRDLLGFFSTFEVSLTLLKSFPLGFADKIIVFLSWLTLGCTHKYNLIRPAEGPLAMKERTGLTPVLDVGSVAKIRSGEIKVVPAIDQLTEGGATFVNGVEEDFDAIILATGYKSSVPSELMKIVLVRGQVHYLHMSLKEGEKCGRDEPKAKFRGRFGLYPVGLMRGSLWGCSKEAVYVADVIAKREAELRVVSHKSPDGL